MFNTGMKDKNPIEIRNMINTFSILSPFLHYIVKRFQNKQLVYTQIDLNINKTIIKL